MWQGIDLLLVNPGNQKEAYGDLSLSLSGIEPPIWCAMMASFIRKHRYSVTIIDADAECWSPQYAAEKIIELNPHLVNIVALGTNPSASSTPKMPAIRQTLNAVKDKAPYLKIILSGLHPSALTKQTLEEEETDFVCQGEGFYTILQLLDLIKSGKDVNNYDINGLWFRKNGKIVGSQPLRIVKDLDNEFSIPAWDLLPMEKYRAHNWHCFEDLDNRSPYAVIYTSLGCPFNCSYCPIHAFYGKPGLRFRSPEKVIEEIDFLVKDYNVKNIKIMDELFVINEKRVLEICNLIIERGYSLNIWVYARVDTVKERILKKMRQAGIKWFAYGFESANERVRKGVSKKIKQEEIKEAVRMTYDADINIIGNFIFGLPDDDEKTMQETLNMAKEFNFEYINFYTAMAYPGSDLYNEALKNSWPLPENWLGYSQLGYESLPLPTKYLSGVEVLRFRDKAFQEYLSSPKYLRKIREKFGEKVERSILDMLKKKLRRKYA
ncbi:MAG: radical SAM protein [bacterium]|nr:radical SAM protein [bacterium]